MPSTRPPIVASPTVAPLLTARAAGAATALVSLDLGLTHSVVTLGDSGVTLPDGHVFAWADVEHVAQDEASHVEGHCFVLHEGGLERVQIFSPAFNRLYSLVATRTAPTLLISGIPMHRIKESDPRRDTIAKVRTLAPVHGSVLDTATGLGYTAIEAARTADRVTTCELDPVVLDVARLNPWSSELFGSPKITQLVGDTFELIQDFRDGSFDRIVHDPPMFNLAGELYSGEFYRQVFRVLDRRGRLFHYVGNPDSPSGSRVMRGVVRRLQDAGFTQIRHRPEAFGLVAQK